MQILGPDNELREVDTGDVEKLSALARELDLEPLDLDDLVHDCCDAYASRRVNNDESLPDDIEAAQDIAYAEASTIGSNVNNHGVEDQVAFLLACLGAEVSRERITSLRANRDN